MTYTPPASTTDVEWTLRRYRAVTLDAVRTYLPSREPRRYLYDMVADYPLRQGKGLRPALCIASCRAFGGTTREAVGSAASIELLHNAFLVHDDIQDESVMRRGRPTLHEQDGLALALNAGDALAFLSLAPLADALRSRPGRADEILGQFQVAVSHTIEGQAVELGWIRDNVTVLSAGDYLWVTAKKTSWYTAIHPCAVGAGIGSRGAADPARFVRFGFFLGALFQIQDDLLNLSVAGTSDERTGDDIVEGKRTLMLIHLLREGHDHERRFVREYLGRPRSRRTGEEALEIARMMESRGSVTYARRWLRTMALGAVREFDAVFGHLPDSADKRFIRGLVPYLLASRPNA